jgi:hypothetical protein
LLIILRVGWEWREDREGFGAKIPKASLSSSDSSQLVLKRPSTLCFERQLRKFKNSLQSRFVEWHQVRHAGFGVQTAAHPFDEKFDAIPGADEPSDQGFQALEWALGNLDVLSQLEPLIDLHKFICPHADFDFADQWVWQKRETIPELHEAANTRSLSDSPVKGCIIKSSKKVPWKH